MAEKWLLLAVVLFVSQANCMDKVNLYDKSGQTVPSSSKEILLELQRPEEVAPERVYALLSALNQANYIGYYQVRKYVDLGTFQFEGCFKNSRKFHEKMCAETKWTSVKKYCDQSLAKHRELCRGRREEALDYFWTSRENKYNYLISRVEQLHKKFLKAGGQDNLPAEQFARKVVATCKRVGLFARLDFVQHSSELLTRIETDSAHLMVDQAELLNVIEAQMEEPVRHFIELAKVVADKCRGLILG